MSQDVNLNSSDAHFAVILERLTEIEGRMKEDREQTADYRQEFLAKVDGHHGRISSLESDRSRALGFAAGAGLAGGGLGAWIHKMMGH